MVEQDTIALSNLVSKQISRLVVPDAIPLGHTIPNQIIERIGSGLGLEQPIPSCTTVAVPTTDMGLELLW